MKKIEKFWNEHLPQTWYSNKKDRKEYFKEIANKRYNIHYNYLKSIAEFDEHNKVLEIGCGIGTDGLQYAMNKADYTGIDLTENAIKISKEHFKIFKQKGRFIKVNAENLPFKDNTFDLVYCFGVIHHTPKPKQIFDEIFRVLKPNGRAIIMLYARGWKHYWLRCFWYGLLHLEFFRLGIQETYNKRSDGKSLTYIFKKKQIIKMIEKFKIESFKKYRMGMFFDWGTTFPKPIVKLVYLLKLEKILGENWIIKIRK